MSGESRDAAVRATLADMDRIERAANPRPPRDSPGDADAGRGAAAVEVGAPVESWRDAASGPFVARWSVGD